MSLAPDQLPKIDKIGRKQVEVVCLAATNALIGEPSYRFLVECGDRNDLGARLIVDFTVNTPRLESVSLAVQNALGDAWECTQVWLPTQDWLSTGALLC